jgi:broad specificity phosphatase PhoE
MRLVLIRHGESEHAVNNIVGGPRGCQGLTPRGREQAGRLAERLRRTGELADCAALLTSPWPRARQTAEILQPALPVTAVTEDPNLCELLPGQADGLTWWLNRHSRLPLTARVGWYFTAVFAARWLLWRNSSPGGRWRP